MLYSPSHWYLKHRLKLRAMALVVAMDDHSNLQRAADALGMTQPAASKMLKEVEDLLEASLFHRYPRGVEPTPVGAMVIAHARNILNELNQIPADLSVIKGKAETYISVGSIKAPALSMVPRALVEFQSKLSHAKVNLLVDSSPALLTKLKQGELDIVVGRLPLDSEADIFDYEELAESQSVKVVVRKGHPWLRRKKIEWAELLDVMWIIPPQGSMLKLQFESIFVQQKLIPPQNLVETHDLDTIRRLLSQTSMVAVLSEEVAEACDAVHLQSMPSSLSFKMQGFGLISLKGKRLSPAVQEMAKILSSIGHSHYPVHSEVSTS
jgi:DNA-binding transcriptional LysR family regulator